MCGKNKAGSFCCPIVFLILIYTESREIIQINYNKLFIEFHIFQYNYINKENYPKMDSFESLFFRNF